MNFDLSTARGAGVAAIGAMVLGIAACASTPVPNDRIAVAHDSVQRAEQNGAPQYAPVQLASAKDKLNKAENAAAHHEAEPAGQFADQANIDAQLAEATANEQKSHKAAMEFDASLQALRTESMRNTQPGLPVVPAQTLPPTQ